MNNKINKIKNSFKFIIDYVEIQLIVTLVSLPILIYWGLPISKMSFIGNLIFLPILMIFLTLSSFIFFTELFSIQNSFFIYLLEKTILIWQKITSIGNNNWLICFSKANIIILIVIPIITFAIIKNKKLNKVQRIMLLSSLLFSFTTGMKLKNKFSETSKINIENKLFIKRNKNGIKIKDKGMFAKKQSVENFVEFNLKQELIKNFGTTKINKLSTNRAGIRTFKAIIVCVDLFSIKKVKIPIFHKKLSKYGWKLFFDMKRLLIKKNIKFKRFKI